MIPDAPERLAAARLYLVCDAIEDTRLRAALRGGVGIVQLRMKDAGEAEILAAAHRFAEACAEHRAPFILNDRPELVVDAGADGVHLGQDDASVAAARARLGPDRIVGLSTHTPEQVDAASALPIDYIGVGPVYATPTKPGRPAVGPALVEYAARHAALPSFAIGGIAPDTIAPVLAAGTARVAVVRALTEADDAQAAAAALLDALARAEVGVGTAA